MTRLITFKNIQWGKALNFIVPCVFLLGATFLQLRYDAIKLERFNLRAPEHRYVMPASVVRHFAFGFQNVLADYYWVTAIQALNKWDRKDTYFPEYFRIISALDPRFSYPYIFATLVVPNRINKESLTWLSEISEIGMRALPENWEIPFYTGMEHYVVGKSSERAVHYLEIAASKKSAPEYVRTTYGIHLMRDATEYEKSRALFTTIYETSDNDETKKIVKERMALLDLIEMLEKASLAYKTKYHAFPSSLADIEKAGFIKLPPDLVEKFTIEVDKTTGKVMLLR